MTPFFHHKRRHSWPYCDPETRRRSLLTLRIPQPQIDPRQFSTPVPGDFVDADDATSAGIDRNNARSHSLWSSRAPESSQQGSSSGLRRMIRPPLDKARSLFVLPTTNTAGERVMISYWMPATPVPILTVQPVFAVDSRRRVVGLEERLLAVERRHRRSHSEQPRSWRRPSESLFPLEEE